MQENGLPSASSLDKESRHVNSIVRIRIRTAAFAANAPVVVDWSLDTIDVATMIELHCTQILNMPPWASADQYFVRVHVCRNLNQSRVHGMELRR